MRVYIFNKYVILYGATELSFLSIARQFWKKTPDSSSSRSKPKKKTLIQNNRQASLCDLYGVLSLKGCFKRDLQRLGIKLGHWIDRISWCGDGTASPGSTLWLEINLKDFMKHMLKNMLVDVVHYFKKKSW